jgi:hypothetical protein
MSIRDIFDKLMTTFGKPMPVTVAMCQNNITFLLRLYNPQEPPEILHKILVVHSICFWFLTGLIFWNPQISKDYFGFRIRHVGTILICSGILRTGTQNPARIRPESGGKDP